ncbi:MAG TPA: sulfite dehydrogenase [Chryseosolibacter sp.]
MRRINRRTLLGGAATAAAVLVQTSFGKVLQKGVSAKEVAVANAARKLGPPPFESGTRSPHEKLLLKTSDTSSRTPLQDLYGTITPSDFHFQRHHSGVPEIDPEKYSLTIHGMVEKPMVFSLRDLKRFPAVSRIMFIECSGNYRGNKEELSPQDICGLTSQSEWTGVKLSTLLREVGVDSRSTWCLAEGGDAALMTRSIPVKKLFDDALIAYAQNGEAIRPEQGYPARLVLPGWEGNTSVKWLRRLEFSDEPFMTREETSKYTEEIADGKIRQFSFVIDARSIITYPAYPYSVEKGWIEIRGLAWSGRGKVVEVEVSTDAGKSWVRAELNGPILDKAHTSFRHVWKWDGNATEIYSRVTDNTGYVQPTLKQLVDVRGGNRGYYFNPITGWQIKSDGKVLFSAGNEK